jgi:pimeloyl-ACP methyl ester carboxylesterase
MATIMQRSTMAALGLALAFGAAARADDAPMPKTPAEAVKMETQDALPLTKFYDTPANLAATKPGDLLRREVFTGYALPKGTKALRILYHSLSAEGKDVATSAAVLIPAGPAPKDGWPVIAWAHGTSGVARQCAPSAMKDVYYGDEGLSDMLGAGLAIVATDYHGLGTQGPHQYVNKTAQAHDVIYSIPAARAAEPSLGKRWVADGHSQGGLASWGVAELQADLKDPGYLGAVSVAGAIRMQGLLAHLSEATEAGFYMPMMAFGVKARFPDFDPSTMLTERALKHYAAVTSKGCWFYAYASYIGDQPGAMLKSGWTELPDVKGFFAENETAKRPIAGPVFVIAGEGDQSVPVGGIRETVAEACKAHMPVTFRTYPGLDHDPTMINSTPDQIAWIKDRFAGKPAPGNCAG